MLYKKNQNKELSAELFKNPTSEYRATPFWAWNCKLENNELIWQINCLRQMGFGGFHMHSRPGMATKYLSDEFMGLVKACVEKAKNENMLAWLYDEDRWPSGAAGGYVTKNPKYRLRHLLFTINERKDIVPKDKAVEEGKRYFIGAYDIVLDNNGCLVSYDMTGGEAKGTKWYAYVETEQPSGWYNGQTYVDTLSKEAMDEFIKITYEGYKKAVGEDFGKAIPAMFTDEPQFSRKQTLTFSSSTNDVILPWTTDFDKTFEESYGMDIIKALPELFWNLNDDKVSQARYCYHDHICERFTLAFADNCGGWCKKNSIALTGHMMEEQSLLSQTAALGEAMRSYRSFGIPGIDMLCDWIELSTAKQAQSAVHQYGKEGMLSELYGVTNWTFDFRGHKFQGDWQAALGVTVRVPHLSWVSMKGSAKRDYPASINYQSPWYKEYPYVENHFARLNTALTRGKPVVNVGVIHPIESYWLHWGPSENTAGIRQQMENNFNNIINWLLFGTVDFDFISESLLPSQCGDISDMLTVGEMKYSAIIVPNCETIRKTTLDILAKFQENGGKLIFVGDCPKYVDAQESDAPKALYEKAVKAQSNEVSVLETVKTEKIINIKNSDGTTSDNLIYNMRSDSDDTWLFIAHGKKYTSADNNKPQNIIISIKGEFTPTIYNTITGEIEVVPYSVKNGETIIEYSLYSVDSVLLKLGKKTADSLVESKNNKELKYTIDFKDQVYYEREEENVYLLDMARYSLDGGEMQDIEEIMRIDVKCRKQLHFPLADGHDVQPWVIDEEKPTHCITLEFDIESDVEADTEFCFEEAQKICLNSKEVEIKPHGYFVDKSIHKVKLPTLTKGKNKLLVDVPFGKRISVESCYLIGNFDVEVHGCSKKIVEQKNTICFGSITSQGMPFYGGNLVYKTEVETPDCDMKISANSFRGSLIKVYVDGKENGIIAYSPYTVDVKNINSGKHTVEYKLFGNRNNTFGSLHNWNDTAKWFGPSHWYAQNTDFGYEYNLADTGILKSPIIEIY